MRVRYYSTQRPVMPGGFPRKLQLRRLRISTQRLSVRKSGGRHGDSLSTANLWQKKRWMPTSLLWEA